MVIGAITQVSFIYVAQGVLAVAIGIWLRYYSKIYPRIYLNTWSYSALFFFYMLPPIHSLLRRQAIIFGYDTLQA